jgi:hypothetical protein
MLEFRTQVPKKFDKAAIRRPGAHPQKPLFVHKRYAKVIRHPMRFSHKPSSSILGRPFGHQTLRSCIRKCPPPIFIDARSLETFSQQTRQSDLPTPSPDGLAV